MNLFTFLFSIVISIGCFWASFSLIKLYIEVKNWDKITARVISKKIALHEKYSTSRTPYGIKAVYQYTYDKIQYTNSKIYLIELMNGQVNYMESGANKAIADIKENMLIYVNPKNPQQSVMFCTGVGLYIIVFIMGFVSLLMGFIYLIKLRNNGL